MAKYAVKIGEIQLQSDKPITMEERKQAIEYFQQCIGNALRVPWDASARFKFD